MRLKKIVACTIAATMVLGSLSMVSAAETTPSSSNGYLGESGSMTLEGFWSAFTDGIALSEEETVIQFTTQSLGEYDEDGNLTGYNNWDNTFYVLYASNDGAVNGDGYDEYFVGRADNYGWGVGSYETSSAPADDDEWAAWLDETKVEGGALVTITAKLSDGSAIVTLECGDVNYTATVADVNKDNTYIAISGQDCILHDVGVFAEDVGSILTGNSKDMSLSYYPASLADEGTTYESSDEDIATVEDGTIYGVADGTATITATCGDYSTSVDVTVTSVANPITAVTPSEESVSVEIGASTTVTATYEPTDTTDDVTPIWTSADESIATVDDGVITGVAAGSTTVTVTIGSASAEIAVEVTETAEPDSEEPTEDNSGDEMTEIVEQYTLDDLSCGDWWTSFTEEIEIDEGYKTVITGTTTSLGDSNWHNMVFVLYSSDDALVYPATITDDDGNTIDNPEAVAANYVEYFVGRVDNYGWGTATYEVVSAPDDWDAWLAETQAGLDFTITAVYVDGTIQITCECGDCVYVVTYEVEDPDLTYYIALTGEQCELTNLVVTKYQSSSDDINPEVGDTDEGTDAGDESGESSPQTGDVLPIVAVLVALCGCAVILVASKRRRV